jgi:glycosyltransferase involved in cell wall biosynthesis
MERFNRRVVRALGELRDAGGVGEVALVALWDDPAHGGAVPRGVRFLPGGSGKVRTLVTFARAVARLRPAVVVYGSVMLVPLAALARVVSPRSRHLLFVHGIEVWERPGAATRWLVRALVSRVISVSRFTAERMQAAYGLGAQAFRLLPNAVDARPARAAARPAAARPRATTRRLLTVSRLSRQDDYKNVDKVILAMPAILRAFPDAHYDVVGDGDWRPALAALADAAGVAERVHFRGWVDDEARDALYAECDVFVLPSTREGFGIVFLEAWQHGVPVIASNRDAAREVVSDGADGFCVDPAPAAIAGAVCALLADPPRRAAMGARGRAKVERAFGHDRFRETLGALLAECGGAGGSAAVGPGAGRG